MKRVLEDLFMGQLASPSFSQGFRWEESRRRVRVVFADVTVADSKHVMLLHELGRLPVYYSPLADVRMDVLEATETTTRCPYKGMATYWSARIGEKIFKDIVWSYHEPLPACTPSPISYACIMSASMPSTWTMNECPCPKRSGLSNPLLP